MRFCPRGRKQIFFVTLVSLAFFGRGLYYCVQQPVWEGYDEFAHFAHIQHLAETGRVPTRDAPVSGEIRRSLELLPLPAAAANFLPKTALTHDDFWRLPAGERLRRYAEFQQLRAAPSPPPRAPLQYEAQQPPLYYLLLAPAYLLARGLSLPAQVLILRVLSLAFATLTIPLAWAIARRVLKHERLALAATVLLASLPGFYIDVCRVANDCLAIPLVAAVLLASLHLASRKAGATGWLVFGALLAAALLTKAYALAFLVLLPPLAVMQLSRRRHALLAVSVVALAAGWWYLRAWQLTGTLSGEQLDAAANGFGLAGRLAALARMDWGRVLDSAAFSHIWLGGWSFLVVRSWMYRVPELFAAAAAAGLAILVIRKKKLAPESAILAAAYVLFCLGIAYHSLAIFLTQRVSTALGWYLYAVVSAEVTLIALGLTGLAGTEWARRGLATLAVLFLALDLFSVHFLLAPYYTGLIAHRPPGGIPAMRIADLLSPGTIQEMLRRLALDQPSALGPAFIAACWALYLLSTAALALAALWGRPPACGGLSGRPPRPAKPVNAK
ncbi:MAG: hypothetical protein ACM336_19245 [Acidobacteriota bacterium]